MGWEGEHLRADKGAKALTAEQNKKPKPIRTEDL